MWTAPYVSHSNDHLTAIRRRERAPSTTSNPELTIQALMSALASSGNADCMSLWPGSAKSGREQVQHLVQA
jgi:hypothetical protein